MASGDGNDRGTTPKVRTTEADDSVELQYEVQGNGPVVVLLHGILSSRRAFSRQQQAFTDEYRMILPSSRGHDSTDATLPPDYGMDTSEIRDLCSILDAECVERIRLVGHSSGGVVAYAFARAFPQRVERLVLIEPTLLKFLPADELRPFVAVIDKGKSDGDMAALRALFEFAGGEAWARLDDTVKAQRLDALSGLAPVVVPHLQALLDFSITPADLQSLSPPTLLLYGTESYAFESIIAGSWRRHRPDLQLVEVKEAGHNLYRDRPDIVNPALLEFLSDVA